MHTQIPEIIRSHWGIENKNHWKRDAQWGVDRPRQHSSPSAQVLAIPRGALLALIDEPLPATLRPLSPPSLLRSP